MNTATMPETKVLVDRLDHEYELVKKSLKDIVKRDLIQRSGSFEWYVMYEEDGLQILMSKAFGGPDYVYMEPHDHEISQETFIVLTGEMEINGSILKAGDSVTIPPKQVHRAKPLTADLKFITILIPPEKVYSNR